MLIDNTKLQRQLHGIDKWIKSNCIGTLNWSMGFGKTYGAILIIKSIQERFGMNKDTIPFVVVPSDATKQLWIREFEEHKIVQYNIVTINKVRDYFRETDIPITGGLLILDEIHRYTSESDIKILKNLHFVKRLGLTGSYPHKSIDIKEMFPVVDKIDEKEAITNNWIPKYINITFL